MPGQFPFYLYPHEGLVLVLVWAAVCVWVLAARHLTTLAGLLVLAGVCQAPLIALTGNLTFQFVDDIPAALLILSAVLGAPRRRDGRALLLLAATALVVLFAASRSPDAGSGLAQARQVMFPVGLVFAGYELRDRIMWPRLLRRVALLGVIVAVWMIAEGLKQWPLFDPVPAVQLQLGQLTILRQGLPLSYWADGIFDQALWFRPGGPFLNPPTAGFFLAATAYALTALPPGFRRTLGMLAVVVAVGMSFARAGALIVLCVTAAYWAWRVVGKVITLAGVAGATVVLFGWLAGQGNTASHSNGLLNGLLVAARTVVGTGFGAFGYQSSNVTGEVSESLLGLYFGWMGVPFVALVAWTAWRLSRNLAHSRGETSRLVWFGVGMLAAAALSETASSLSGAGVGWLLVGLCLTGARGESTQQATRLRFEDGKGTPVVQAG